MSWRDNTAEIYDAFAAHYRDYSQGKSAYIAGVDRLVIGHFKGKAQHVLDYGAGDGIRGAALCQEIGVRNLVQADISDAMLTRCRQLAQAQEFWDIKRHGWEQSTRRFDVIWCLWNVLGHIPSMEARVMTLKKLRGLLKPDGVLCFDVNNRHWRGYGRLRVTWRRLLDAIRPDYSRGDTKFDWKIDGKSYPAHGHLFTLAEVRDLLAQSGFKIRDWRAVDYKTGAIGRKVSHGQLFFIAVPA